MSKLYDQLQSAERERIEREKAAEQVASARVSEEKRGLDSVKIALHDRRRLHVVADPVPVDRGEPVFGRTGREMPARSRAGYRTRLNA